MYGANRLENLYAVRPLSAYFWEGGLVTFVVLAYHVHFLVQIQQRLTWMCLNFLFVVWGLYTLCVVSRKAAVQARYGSSNT